MPSVQSVYEGHSGWIPACLQYSCRYLKLQVGRGLSKMRAVAVLLLAASVMLVEGFVSPLLGSSSSYALNLAGGRGQVAEHRVVMMSSKQPEGKRTKRRSKRKREDGTSKPVVGMRDFELDELIEDERKSALPRLDELKKGRRADEGGDGDSAGLLLPRELEQMKLKERTEEVKGAPSYFPLMTRITWGAIITMVVVEVVVHSPFVKLPGGVPME